MNTSPLQKFLSRLLLLCGIVASTSVAAWDFLYVEACVESTRLSQITAIGASGQGMLTLVDDCDICPDQIPYDAQSQLETPFATNRPNEDLVVCQGLPAEVYASLPTPVATGIVVYPASSIQVDE